MKYYMHVNYIERVFDIPEICKRCKGAGFDGIELRGWDRSGKLTQEEYLPKAFDAASSNNLDLVLGCKTEAINSNEELRSQSWEDFKNLLDFAGQHDIKILNVFTGSLVDNSKLYSAFDKQGSALGLELHYKLASDFLQRAGDYAAQYDIDLCLEMHNGYLHDLAEPTAKLLEMVDKPNVKANFDMGNIYLNNKKLSIDDCFNKIGSHIGYLHLKNMIAYEIPDRKLYRGCALDSGDIDNYDLVRRLLAAGYRGPWAMENVMPGDKRPFIRRDLEYVKSILAELA